MTIELGDEERTIVSCLLERATLRLGGLADARIQDHDGLLGFDGAADVDHLVKQVLLLLVPARCVDNDHIKAVLFEGRDTCRRNRDGIRLCVRAIERNARLGCILLELVKSAGAERISTHETRPVAALLVPERQLGTRRRLT